MFIFILRKKIFELLTLKVIVFASLSFCSFVEFIKEFSNKFEGLLLS